MRAGLKPAPVDLFNFLSLSAADGHSRLFGELDACSSVHARVDSHGGKIVEPFSPWVPVHLGVSYFVSHVMFIGLLGGGVRSLSSRADFYRVFGLIGLATRLIL